VPQNWGGKWPVGENKQPCLFRRSTSFNPAKAADLYFFMSALLAKDQRAQEKKSCKA
jgi:hypothetical protein